MLLCSMRNVNIISRWNWLQLNWSPWNTSSMCWGSLCIEQIAPKDSFTRSRAQKWLDWTWPSPHFSHHKTVYSYTNFLNFSLENALDEQTRVTILSHSTKLVIGWVLKFAGPGWCTRAHRQSRMLTRTLRFDDNSIKHLSQGRRLIATWWANAYVNRRA